VLQKVAVTCSAHLLHTGEILGLIFSLEACSPDGGFHDFLQALQIYNSIQLHNSHFTIHYHFTFDDT